MSFDYATLAADAVETLAEFGGPVTRRAATLGAYDPATGTASGTTADTTRQGVVFSFGEGVQYVRGQLVQVADRQLLLDATGPVSMTDTFTAQGVEYSVVSFDEIKPAAVAVLYDIHVRAGA